MILCPVAANAEDYVAIAVASNFAATARELVAEFARQSNYDVRISSASTGKLYAQIQNGAPFDVLLAADALRPQRLEAGGAGVPETRFTYAMGTLVLWSRQAEDCRDALYDDEGGRIAIANPETAPYGAAAKTFLQRAGLWELLQDRLVIGENIAQTLQFAASGNARLGFVAASQSLVPTLPPRACSWPVPSALHGPIDQQAILLRHGENSAGARSFLEFLRSEAGRAIILRHGYGLSGGQE